MPLFYQPLLPSHHILSAEESRHAIKVLRMVNGDEIDVTDGRGAFYKARITDSDFSECAFVVTETKLQPLKDYRIHIAPRPHQNMDRIEWFVEKAVELGVDEISFVECKTSERRSVNLDRLEKLAISALKQSQQAFLAKLNPLAPIREIVSLSAGQKFIAHVDSANPLHLKSAALPGRDYLILIGPEGDFTPAELEESKKAGFQKVSLGPTRLRTETAGLAAGLILNLVNQ